MCKLNKLYNMLYVLNVGLLCICIGFMMLCTFVTSFVLLLGWLAVVVTYLDLSLGLQTGEMLILGAGIISIYVTYRIYVWALIGLDFMMCLMSKCKSDEIDNTPTNQS